LWNNSNTWKILIDNAPAAIPNLQVPWAFSVLATNRNKIVGDIAEEWT
jgi:hypothetical protein